MQSRRKLAYAKRSYGNAHVVCVCQSVRACLRACVRACLLACVRVCVYLAYFAEVGVFRRDHTHFREIRMARETIVLC